jgi:hypothetical protein
MADTGWLQAAASTISSVQESPGSRWAGYEWLAVPNTYGCVNSLILSRVNSPGYPSMLGNSVSKQLVWDWVVPQTLSIPGNAVVTGIEVILYLSSNQGTPTRQPEIDIGPTDFRLGDAIMYQGPPVPALIHDNDNIPGPSPPANALPFGGPGFLGGIPANTRVSDFLAQSATSSTSGDRHAMVVCHLLNPGMPTPEYNTVASCWAKYVEMKVYYEVDAAFKDMAATPDMSVTVPTSDLDMIRKLAAVVITDVLIEQAQLGGISSMESNPEIEIGLPADLTNGTGFIDSTALPVITVTIPDIDLALLRFSDMRSVPEVVVSAVAIPPGTRVNMSAGPLIKTTLIHGFTNVVGVYAEPELTVSMDDPGLIADGTVRAEPFVVVSLTANLQGDINLADDCSEAELTTVVSLLANLGYARGLYSNPRVDVTMDGNGLVVGAALEFEPLVSVTIPFANLRSKFAEPAPDHRTVFKCPVDRTIRITRKDKTIL